MKIKKILSIFLIFLFSQVLISKDSWWDIYFTKSKEVNPQTALITVIKKSTKTIDCAFFDLSSTEIIKSILKANKRGTKIRIVIDSNYVHSTGINKLISEGINVISDNRNGLMHNKFAILDSTYLWTGSYNPTYNGAFRNNNNSILIKSKKLCEIYQKQFDQMFEDKIFGNRYYPEPFSFFTKKRKVKIDNTKIEVLFAPEDNLTLKIVNLIKSSKSSIRLMGFSFTEDLIAESLIAQHKKGVNVKVLMERRGSGTEYSEFVKLKIEGVSVKKDKKIYIMHHKVIIIDNKILITGSFNFSKNAQVKNDENILVIENKKIALKYLKEFNRLYNK